MVVSYETDATKVQLLRVHIYLKLQCRLQSYLRDFEYSNTALFGQVTIVPASHLCILSLTRQFTLLVPAEVILYALSDDFLNLHFALGRVSNRLLCHHTQVVRHSNACFRRWRQTQ